MRWPRCQHRGVSSLNGPDVAKSAVSAVPSELRMRYLSIRQATSLSLIFMHIFGGVVVDLLYPGRNIQLHSRVSKMWLHSSCTATHGPRSAVLVKSGLGRCNMWMG